MAELVFGRNAVVEVLKSNRKVFSIQIAKGQKEDEVLKLAKKRKLDVNFVDKKQIDKKVKGRHQGILISVEEYQYASIDDLFRRVGEDEQPLFLILDQIEDVHNLGALMRTADCSGVHGIIVPKDRSAKLNATVARTSAGAIEHVPVASVTNLNRTIEDLKKRGVWIVGTDAHEASDYRAVDYKGATAIVIGSEGKGMRPLVRNHCDFLVYIPMKGHVNSLNASVAGGLLMYEAYNQRNPIK
jgi:23S rRNA (guanosine2251-2'-O)-methyltransferase